MLAAAIVGLLMWPGSDLGIVALLPPLIVTLGVGGGPLRRALGSVPVFFAGEVSYAVYLLHSRFVRLRDGLDVKLTTMLGSIAPIVTCVLVYGMLLVAAWIRSGTTLTGMRSSRSSGFCPTWRQP
jgi:peptidoglycan/LPS O-acetylase OafA/YrhL